MKSKRRIATLTSSRADYGLLYWILRQIQAEPRLQLQLIVSGSHLRHEHGLTVRQIERDGLPIAAAVEILGSDDGPLAVAGAIGRAVGRLAETLQRLRPDLLLLLGDRYETLAAATAATVLRTPIAHIHGGETTQGAIDEAFRHAITKMSHLHFAATAQAARRIIQLGEPPQRVHVCGAPGLETIRRCPRLGVQELGAALEVPLQPGFLLVTYHPATLEPTEPLEQVNQLLAGLATTDRQLLITAPNADAGRGQIAARLADFAASRSECWFFPSVGQSVYVNLMRHAAAMVGNSSSGIIEAPSLELPVVNVGDRQRGRLRAGNVIDVPCQSEAIANAIKRATSDSFRQALRGMTNPYGDGHTAERIVAHLGEVELGPELLQKRFYDLQRAQPTCQTSQTEDC